MKLIRMAAVGLALTMVAQHASADVLDGSRAGDSYGSALSVQTVQTGFGDNFSELNAGYATAIEGDMLRMIFTGNVEANFNKLDIFIDSVSGGDNVIDGANARADDDGLFTAMSGFTFDSGFEADYALIARRGNAGGDKFDFTMMTVADTSVTSFFEDIFSGALEGSNADIGNGVGVAYDNSNTAGVTGGSDAADQAAAAAVETGLEIWIPLSLIGNPGLGDTILISVMQNNQGHDFLSNQFLGGLPAPQGNLGGGVGSVDLNQFAGDQFFAVTVVPEPSAFAVLGCIALGMVSRRRRK